MMNDLEIMELLEKQTDEIVELTNRLVATTEALNDILKSYGMANLNDNEVTYMPRGGKSHGC